MMDYITTQLECPECGAHTTIEHEETLEILFCPHCGEAVDESCTNSRYPDIGDDYD